MNDPTPRRLRAYRALLRLFPSGFLEDQGPALERCFLDMSAAWKAEHGKLGVRFWSGMVRDTALEALGEWASAFGEGVRSVTALTMGEHMAALWGDVRFALRQLVRQPVYALTIVVLMAVGIAGNAAVFRVVNGLFLRPLPFDEPEQLVDLDETAPSWDLEYLSIAYRDFDTWRAENGTFQSMAVLDYGGGNLVYEGQAQRVTTLLATHDIDDVLRIEPLMGRFFGPEEDTPDGPRGALLSQGYWQQHFAADPDAIGKTVSIDGFPVDIIGVLPPEARMIADVDMWLPLRQDRSQWRGWGLNGIGRMKPDVTIEQARADLLGVHKGMIDEFEVNEISSPVVSSLRERYLGTYRVGSGFLMGAVAIVLLIACANIAGLMTARSLTRGPEIGVRLAMGAPRGRIVRQLLTESLVLAVVGAGLGVLLGIWGSGALVAPLADQFPRWISFDLDASFVLFTVAITVAAALLFGLAPAWHGSAINAAGGGRRTTGTKGRKRAMSALVTGEVALAMALLVVGGLSVMDMRQVGRTDPGFVAEGLVGYNLTLPTHRYDNADARLAFIEGYVQRLEAIPGVESASVSSSLPLSGHWGTFFMVDGAPPRAEDEGNPVVLQRIVTPSYFETVGVRFGAGAPFDDFAGREGASDVVVVNETFVGTHLSHLADPVGARISYGTDEPGPDAEWMTVVGVTRDVKHYGLDQEMRPGVYIPMRQRPLSGFNVGLRIRGDSESIMSAVRAATAEIDVELPVYNVRMLDQAMDDALMTRRAMSWLIGAFSAVALLLAMAGIYGVISYSVGQRRQEIGIRMAMGAERQHVLGQVVRQGMVLVAIGVAIGVGLALAGARVVSGMLVGVSATDPVVYVSVTALLVLVAAAANYVPARRAAGLDPMGVLRTE